MFTITTMKYICKYWDDEESPSTIFNEYTSIEIASYNACKLFLEHKFDAVEVIYNNKVMYHISHQIPDGEFYNLKEAIDKTIKRWKNGRERFN